MDMKPHLKTPATELTLTQHPILQITAASNKHLLDETPQVLKSAVSVTAISRRTPDQF